jgi:hypothetical protein
VPLPDYRGGSIVNLMASIALARGSEAALYSPLELLSPSRLLTSKNIVLIVIDGLGYECLTSAGKSTGLYNHLQGRISSVFPSTTATAITTFLTGIAPQQHGLTGWHMYLRELGTVMAVLPFHPRPGAPRAKGFNTARVFDQRPIFDQLKVRSYVVVPSKIIDSVYNAAYSGSACRRAYNSSLQTLFRTVVRVLREHNERKYVYAYYPELDRVAHEYGPAGRKTQAHLAEIDLAFTQFLEQIKGSNTTVIMTADHGFIETKERIELDNHPLLANTLRLPLCGESRVAYCYVYPERRALFEHYVETRLAGQATLLSSEELINRGYFGLGPPHPRLQERIGDYTLIMKDGYVIKDWLPGEERYRHIGVHGGMSAAEMYVPLIVVTV